MRTDPMPSPELIGLYQTYTASAESIGARLASLAEAANAERPLIVVTHGDIALYAGGGAPPVIEGFRLQTRGFKELAAISHLGPAVATVARMKALAPDGSWRSEAARLIEASRAAREANSRELWADRIALAAFSGREGSIARMVDYTCRRAEEFLWQALRDEDYLDAAAVRRDYLAGPAALLPVPVNRVMVATFFLSGLDLAHRLIRWFDAQDLAWESAMVLVAGQQGRPTAGVTVESNSVAKVIRTVSRGRLPRRNLLIAPHAPVFPLYDGTDVKEAAALEPAYRRLWSAVMATADLGEDMFAGYPRFDPDQAAASRPADGPSSAVAEMPPIGAPDDWLALTTRLRVVLEDPRQLLSGAVTDYASQQLVDNDNDPRRVVVPGLDGEPYPELTPATPNAATSAP
ncbi:DUF5624 domain-containing protein [Dactylosporangium sucinum]|nr:DUF5624 domain-containing protein [Dactylosporangium sucinum]